MKFRNNNTKKSATSPLSGSPGTLGSYNRTLKSEAAVVDLLGIDVSLAQRPDSVNGAHYVFSEIVEAIDNNILTLGAKKKVSAHSNEQKLEESSLRIKERVYGDIAMLFFYPRLTACFLCANVMLYAAHLCK